MAAGKYRLRDGEKVRLTRATIATGTVIEAGDLVALSSGLVVKAGAGDTNVAWCPDGHAANTGTVCEVTLGNDFTLKGTLDVNFLAAYKGVEYDINDTTQTIDQGGGATKVLKVGISEEAGTVGSTSDVTVRIMKPLF